MHAIIVILGFIISRAWKLGSPRTGHTATALPGVGILLAGGRVDRGIDMGEKGATWTTYPAEAELCSGVGQSREVGTMRVARDGHAALALDRGRVLVAGGRRHQQRVAELELYDAAQERWLEAGRLPLARSGCQLVRDRNGRVLVVGGSDGWDSEAPLVLAWEAGTLTRAGRLVVPRTEHTVTRLRDGRVLVAGGRTGGVPLASCELLDSR